MKYFSRGLYFHNLSQKHNTVDSVYTFQIILHAYCERNYCMFEYFTVCYDIITTQYLFLSTI